MVCCSPCPAGKPSAIALSSSLSGSSDYCGDCTPFRMLSFSRYWMQTNPMLLKKIAVLLVDDHMVVRQGLRALLAAETDLEIVGEAENGRQAVTLAKQISPDVIVMDVAMPLLNGLEATRQIARDLPSARVLVLTSYNDEECVAQLMEAG